MKNKKLLFKNKKGFTLIEMLIVIVIIGILAAAIIPRLNSARGRANDVARKADINQVATALITYQLDTGKFPVTGTTIDNISKQLIDGGLTSIPRDPVNTSLFSGIELTPGTTPNGEYYIYTPIIKNGISGGGFILMAQMESHGQANYVFCDNSAVIKHTTDYSDPELNLCSKVEKDETTCSPCKYTNSSQLRYIYKY